MQMTTVLCNRVLELTFTASEVYTDAFNEVTLDVNVTSSSGETLTYPAFWAGGNLWKLRISAEVTGIYRYNTICSNTADRGLHNVTGRFEVINGVEDNELYRQGRHIVGHNRRYISQSDGTPFFWLADTWWAALVSRVNNEDFELLAKDRAEKGFNVVQLVAGLMPAFRDENVWDQRVANEGGFPWEEGFTAINPAYFDHADKRIELLVDNGIMPCIFGAWGEFLGRMGVDKMKAHWRYLVARWGAYPVIWSVAGEALFQASEDIRDVRRAGWTEVTRYLRNLDPFKRLITIHPTYRDSREMIDDESLLDINMLQTSHSYMMLDSTVSVVKECVDKQPPLPTLNGEVCYEGILGTCWQDVQRFCFWTSVLSGSCGHTYGAAMLFFFQTNEVKFVHDMLFWIVEGDWKEGYKLPGSYQMGVGRRFMERYPWWDFTRRIEKGMTEEETLYSFAAGIPGAVWMFYLPATTDNKYTYYRNVGLDGGLYGDQRKKIAIEPEADYFAFFFNPRTAEEVIAGNAVPDSEGNWAIPQMPTGEDWLLVLQSKM